MLNALATAPQGSKPATPSTHRLRRGLPGYLILFAPHAFASQRQSSVQKAAFATGVPLDIYEFHLYTENSTILSSTQAHAVSSALPGLSPGLSHPTCIAAYTRFTPSNSEQRLHPLSYRGCWHRVSRCLLRRYRHHAWILASTYSSLPTELYNPKAFITHAASLRQAFAHCARFPTAASRRSLDRVSVPVWLIILSDQLPVLALVGHYPTN